MLPHERSLVARMEGRPFALLGVNCDEERETVQRVSFRDHITWRNWWNGGGSFTKVYGVHGLPATFVLDADGVIRYRNPPGAELDGAAEVLVEPRAGLSVANPPSTLRPGIKSRAIRHFQSMTTWPILGAAAARLRPRRNRGE